MDETPERIYQPDQLIVDLQSWPLVRAKLANLHVTSAVEEHAALGLVRLSDLLDGEEESVDVDGLLAVLRQDFAAERDGFVPVMGRNRFVNSTIGPGVLPLGTKIMANGSVLELDQIMKGAIPAPAAAFGPDAITIRDDGGHGIRIGLVDTPIQAAMAAHLKVQVVGADVPADAPEPVPFCLGHGTFVSGIIRRYAPAAEILLRPVLAEAGGRADSWEVAKAMIELVEQQQVHVLNISLGCFAAGTGAPLVMSRAIERIGRRAMVVAAAGNHGNLVGLMRGRTPTSAIWPAALPVVIAVGSSAADGQPSTFSPDRPWVDCLAPGEQVVSDYPAAVTVPKPPVANRADGDMVVDFPQDLARWSGTSFSTALVSAGIAARMDPPDQVTAAEAFSVLLDEPNIFGL